MSGENPDKVATALARFTPRVVQTVADFDLGYRLLDAQFGPVNELERREVLERWFTEGSLSPADAPIRARYHMLLLTDADGQVAAVRDCFTALDRAARRIVVLMSHSLVLPSWRRSGVASIVRASPVFFARLHARTEGVDDPEILIVSEMEHIEPAQRDTLVRLFAYVRAGFRIAAPWLVPYAQPDFRDLAALGEPPRPIPFMLLVRRVGREGEATISWGGIQAIFDGLQAIHEPTCGLDQLLAIRQVALARRTGDDHHVPLYLPDLACADDIAPLLRSALAPLYPADWHDRPVEDPEAERRALARALLPDRSPPPAQAG